MRLKGLEQGFNDNVEKRGIVVHGASYVHRRAIHRVACVMDAVLGVLQYLKKISKPLSIKLNQARFGFLITQINAGLTTLLF